MGYAIYRIGMNGKIRRWGGYGVPAYCEYPNCTEEIDRGMAYACSGEPFSELGCDRYFCSKHRNFHNFNTGHGRECYEVCKRCAKRKPPYPYKREHPDWIKHILKDKSWAQYRKENPDEVIEMKKPL